MNLKIPINSLKYNFYKISFMITKRYILLFYLTSLCIILFGCSKEVTKPNDNSGIYESKLILSNNLELLYTIFIPDVYKKDGPPVPLIIALHYGWSGTKPQYIGKDFLTSLIKPALESSGALIIAPDCPSSGWTTYSSKTAILELIEYLKKNYKIDSNKIVLTGYSLGGIGTWYMISQYPSIFSAGIIVSGSCEEDWARQIKNKPLYIIHSMSDEVLPYLDVIKMVTIVQKQDSLVTLVSLTNIGHYETEKFVEPLKKSVPWLANFWR
jgi:predicted peptidase